MVTHFENLSLVVTIETDLAYLPDGANLFLEAQSFEDFSHLTLWRQGWFAKGEQCALHHRRYL